MVLAHWINKTKLDELLKEYSDVKSFVNCRLSKTDKGIIGLSWVWDETALTAEEKYDGIFALLSNYSKKEVLLLYKFLTPSKPIQEL